MHVFDYDNADQLTGATITNGTTGAVLRRYAYGYDKAGNRTGEQIDLGVSTATHNDLNQLTSVSASAGPVKFAGRLSESGMVYVANSLATMGIQNTSFVAYPTLSSGSPQVELKAMDYATNWVTNVFQVALTNNGLAKTLTYDLNGNLINLVTASYTNEYEWDGADRLVKISRRAAGGQWNVTDFAYDGLGRRIRISETTNSSTTTKSFLWCDTELCEERNSTGGTVNRRFFGQGEQISTTEYVFTRDHLGSVREMIGSGETIQARYEYDPYGRRAKVSGGSDADFGYTGHYYHQKSGLHTALFRTYDADSARWLARDPLGEQEGANLYAYVANGPLKFVDPYGLAMNEIQQKLLQEALNVVGSSTHLKQLKKYDKDHRYDPRTGRAFRVDLADKHHEYAHVHIFKSVNDIPKKTDKVLVYDSKLGAIRKAAGSIVVLGVLGLLSTAQASAAEIVQTLNTTAQDCLQGEDDWMYVDLLTLRHQLNQQASFSGDVAMNVLLRHIR